MKIRPELDSDKPLPYNLEPDTTQTFEDELVVTANTSKLLEELGILPELDEDTAKQTTALLEKALKDKDKKALTQPEVAYGARQFVELYGKRLAMEMSDVRIAVTNKLMELANCGDPRYELKALELLGKHSDISLFTERSELTINYKTSSDLEEAIKERVKRLLNAKVVESVPLSIEDLDDELGVVEITQEKEEQNDEDSSENE
jgi:hypothetical protein